MEQLVRRDNQEKMPAGLSLSHTSDKGIGIKGWILGQKLQPKSESKSGPEIHDKNRIAVLPFSSISSNSEDEYFADGMTEELIATLSLISGMRVIARTSVMRYKAASKGVAEIGHELKVGTILEGSVRKFENRLRTTVELIDTSSEEHLWGESYDRDLKDIFAIQSEIARKIADALKVKVLHEEVELVEKTPTSSIEAYTLYLRGRAFWNQRTEEGLRNAIGYFEQAIKSDPNYAVAYSGLADSYISLANYFYQELKEVIQKAKANAIRALELNASLAEAHASLGNVFDTEWDFESAAIELEKAIQLSPSYATGHHWYAHNLLFRGYVEEAISEIRRAKDLDPFSPILAVAPGAILTYAGRYNEAIQEFKNELILFPDYWTLHTCQGRALIASSKFEEGISELKKAILLSKGNILAKLALAEGYATSGKRDEAIAILNEFSALQARQYVSPLLFATVHASLDNKDEAFRWLEKAYHERSGGLPQLIIDPLIKNKLGSDPRFQALLQKMGLKT